LLYQAEFWVAVAFLIFLAILWRAGAHRMILAALDDRAERIRTELAEARHLKDEATRVLADYQRKRREAESEAKAIIDQAKSEAEEITATAEARMQEFVARRTRMAETKIAQAEIQALADVRDAAADAAVKAAEKILTETVKGKTAEELISVAIKDVKARLD
jgi:F-type H+-transporting ATPase subunit b